jgi:hypothetical protein
MLSFSGAGLCRKLVLVSAATTTYSFTTTSSADQQNTNPPVAKEHSSNDSGGSTASNSSSSDEKKLAHVIVLHRHGDRAPVTKSIGPKYPHTIEAENAWRTRLISGKNEELLKEVAKAQCSQGKDDLYTGRDVSKIPYGQLTDVGSEQLQALGASLKYRYTKENLFLPEDLNGDHIFARSTNICRTINSLRSLLVGLYGMESAEDVASRCVEDRTKGVTTFPVIRSFPEGHDPMIDGPCADPALKDETRKKIIEEHSIPHGYPNEYEALNFKMQQLLGFDRVNFLQAREQLVCMQSHGVPFPEGLDESDISKLYDIELWVVKKLFGDPAYNAMAIGAFYLELHDRLKEIQGDAAPELMSIYSAHDYTLIPFLAGLQILPEAFPHYAAYVVMEIADGDSKSDKYVRFLYNGEVVVLPGCEGGWVGLQYVVDMLKASSTGAPLPAVPVTVPVTVPAPVAVTVPVTVRDITHATDAQPTAVDASAAATAESVTAQAAAPASAPASARSGI